MKIALITKRVSDSLGRAERVSVYLIKNLSDEGHSVHVLSGYINAEIEGAHINIIKVSKWFSPWRLISFQRKGLSVSTD